MDIILQAALCTHEIIIRVVFNFLEINLYWHLFNYTCDSIIINIGVLRVANNMYFD